MEIQDAVEPFAYGGVNHLALVCRDMGRTVDFYTRILGMPLVKTIELPFGLGQHFFFDCGGGSGVKVGRGLGCPGGRADTITGGFSVVMVILLFHPEAPGTAAEAARPGCGSC